MRARAIICENQAESLRKRRNFARVTVVASSGTARMPRLLLALLLAVSCASAAVLFRENFNDAALPRWNTTYLFSGACAVRNRLWAFG